jgi:hypothetical protein
VRPRRKKKPASCDTYRNNKRAEHDGDEAQKPKPIKTKSRKRFPWRKHIPPQSVDPISLESLLSLSYPPFALVASEPYEPVPEWPIPESMQTDSQLTVDLNENKEDEDERRKRILLEQWGGKAPNALTEKATKELEESISSLQSPRHYHLYDGRALAYYMVSQLQFIDPLNRRDLTRPEIVMLDQYLRRHGFADLSVTEAYDKRGITISTASGFANTEAGRAAILQQEATLLLNALFGDPSASVNRADTISLPQTAQPINRIRAQYQAHEQQRQQQRSNRPQRNREEEDIGVYGVHGQGLVVIDDSLNPGLRGTLSTFVPTQIASSSVTGSLWAAGHIASRFGSMNAPSNDFPSLSDVSTQSRSSRSITDNSYETKKKLLVAKPAPTLTAITKVVKKTSPEELQRQREARQEARRRAAAANLPFGVGLVSDDAVAVQHVASDVSSSGFAASEAQLERNKALAEALGVKSKGSNAVGLSSEFEDELKVVVYPDSLIVQARERQGVLMKIERKWTQLMRDDTSSSLSLNPMDRATRVFVHEYSDFWNFHTESFDPEGRRYIHCRKMTKSRIPTPLLSEAVRNWRGPILVVRAIPTAHAERMHLALKPRTVSPLAPTDPALSLSGLSISGSVATLTMLETNEPVNSRVEGLVRERPKLQLQQRSLPTKLPPLQSPNVNTFDTAEELDRQRRRMDEKALKEKKRKEREQRVLEAAFASDDEASVNSNFQGAW